jgi:thiosulfate dehydrogenase
VSKTNLAIFCIAALVALAIGAQSANAFPTYSQNRDATNCRLCHGNFRADNYISNSDGEDWGNLHNLHRNVMVFEDDPEVSRCNTCHRRDAEGSFIRFPVRLSESAGGVGEGISCLGCHGRWEDAGNDDLSDGLGAGLRQHHTNAGINACMVCHADADPENYTPVGEDVLPPYYFTPDDVFLLKPTDPCSSFGEENYAGIWEGLDNDGDGAYDVLDADCAPPFGKLTICHVPPQNPAAAKTISVNGASLAAHLAHGDLPGECPEDPFASANMIRGGRMYDRFWAEAGVEPTTDHPLWALQSSNTRTGSTTWRCKECHGWDYKGAAGAYGPGNSHFTGFGGIFGTALTAQGVVELLADPAGHDYRSQGLTYGDLWDLAKFVVNGQIDTDDILVGPLFNGDATNGATLFASGVGGQDPGCAACHGADGMTPPLGHPEFDEFPQVIARENPWEFQHKVRFGQPGHEMRGIVLFSGTAQQTNDIGAHAQQNLP